MEKYIKKMLCPRCQGQARPIDRNTWRCTRCGYTWTEVHY